MIDRILVQCKRMDALQCANDDGSKQRDIQFKSFEMSTDQNESKLTFKLVICVNAFPQSPHTYGRTCEWIRSWFLKLAACVKAINSIEFDVNKIISTNLRLSSEQNRNLYFFGKLDTDICVQLYGCEYELAAMTFWRTSLSKAYTFLLRRTSGRSAAKKFISKGK